MGRHVKNKGKHPIETFTDAYKLYKKEERYLSPTISKRFLGKSLKKYGSINLNNRDHNEILKSDRGYGYQDSLFNPFQPKKEKEGYGIRTTYLEYRGRQNLKLKKLGLFSNIVKNYLNVIDNIENKIKIIKNRHKEIKEKMNNNGSLVCGRKKK